jgi:hypothetical protein
MNLQQHHSENFKSCSVCSLVGDKHFVGVVTFQLGFSESQKRTKIIHFKDAWQPGIKHLSTLAIV